MFIFVKWENNDFMWVNNYKIAIINPFRPDGLARTIFDGILSLNNNGSSIDFRLSNKFDYDLPINDKYLPREEFINFARKADLIFIIWGKDVTDIALAEEIDCFSKTIYIDGSEVGKNRRFDVDVQKEIADGTYEHNGKVDLNMLKKCALYFRREKPYLPPIIPLPFGIENKYVKNYSGNIKKDIDFICIFGQDEYPLLRRRVREQLEKYCKKNNFLCYTKKTDTPEEFYKLLARSKVGISVGGGGFDTFRFWEILANNCLLLTEKIDIYEPNSSRLHYNRIWEFSNITEFELQLQKIGNFLENKYNQDDLGVEYEQIMHDHSSESRVLEIIDIFNNFNNNEPK